jgi:hypothetical protein
MSGKRQGTARTPQAGAKADALEFAKRFGVRQSTGAVGMASAGRGCCSGVRRMVAWPILVFMAGQGEAKDRETPVTG